MKLQKLIALFLLTTLLLSGCDFLSGGNTNDDTPDIDETPPQSGDISDKEDKEDDKPTEHPIDPSPDDEKPVSRVNITAHGGLTETAYIEFSSFDNATGYNIYLKGGKFDNFTLLNSDICYLQELSDGKLRANLIGLAAGEYEIKVIPVVDGIEAEKSVGVVSISVSAYDRSGYAHFKYDEGVGAYNNDGTLKDNAIVIYVTEENKNSVMSTVAELSEYMFNIPGTDKQAAGIGWWLNNSQYIKSTSDTYGPDAFDLGFTAVTGEHPIVIRIVDKVTTPEGLTAQNSYIQGGGGVGDKGNMARARDLKNVTIEGVGFDAEINGWGISLIGYDPTGELGRNFEIRNLIFRDYSEDAIEITGKQENGELISTVERIWIHNNCFYSGYYDNSETEGSTTGDGTVDFKYGQYYTLSYNYFEGCDKTMLVGSSDDALQFNVTMHHNLWYNCRQRVPLVRHANIHFYNNYILLNGANSPLYVSSLRADCYMFSENNYYEGARAVVDASHSGGNGKYYGNAYLGCYLGKDMTAFTVTDRTASVEASASCIWGDISYKNFDTNPELFYYDELNKVSDCYLTDAATARLECIKISGSYYRTVLNQAAVSTEEISKVPDINEYIDLSGGSYSSQPGVSDTGIIYTTEGKAIGKGVIVSFRLLDFATVRVDTTSASEYPMYSSAIVNSYGEVMLNGSGEALLCPGSYCLVSGASAYNTTVNSLEFIKYEGNDLITLQEQHFKQIYSKIPERIEYTDECYRLITDAIYAYEGLGYENEYSPYPFLEEYFSLGELYAQHSIEEAITASAKDRVALTMLAKTECDLLLSRYAEADIPWYDRLMAQYKEIIDGGVKKTFDDGVSDSSGFFSITGNLKSGVAAKTYDGITYTTAMKTESDTKMSITFATEDGAVLMIISDSPKNTVLVDGKKHTSDVDGVFIIELSEGSHSIARGDTQINLYALIVIQ